MLMCVTNLLEIYLMYSISQTHLVMDSVMLKMSVDIEQTLGNAGLHDFLAILTS